MAVMGRVRTSLVERSTLPSTCKGARKVIRELRGPVARHGLWWVEEEAPHDGPSLSWFGARAEGGDRLVLSRYRVAPAARRSRVAEVQDLGRLTLHAVARCLQRNKTLAWADVRPLLAEATANCLLLGAVACACRLRQIAVPAGAGLFLGSPGEHDVPNMETYVVLDDALPSRWHPVRRATLNALAVNSLTPTDICVAVSHGDNDALAVAGKQIGLALKPIWWLQEEYDPKLDPLSEAWGDYRLRQRDCVPRRGVRVVSPGSVGLLLS